MQITFFGAIWILLLIYCFFSSDHRKMLFVLLFSMVLQSNNILYLGETGIGTQAFTAAIGLVRLLMANPSPYKLKGAKHLLFFCGGLLFAIVFSLLVNKVLDTERLVPIAMIAVYAAVFVTLCKKDIRVDALWLKKAENAIIITVLVVGALQVLCKSGLSFLTGPLRTLIYNDIHNSDVIFNYKTDNRLYSTFMEPSYCGAFLVGAFGLIAVRKDLTRKNVLLAIAVGIEILLSRSSTAYGGLAIIACLLLVTNAEKKVFKFILPAGILAGVAVLFFNMDLLNEVIFDKAETGSAVTRNQWNEAAIKAFLSNPLFGVGYGKQRGSSLVYTIMAELGIIGCGVYLLNTGYQIKHAVLSKAETQVRGRNYFVLGIVICQFIACPDLSFTPFWLGLYLIALSLRVEQNTALKEAQLQ